MTQKKAFLSVLLFSIMFSVSGQKKGVSSYIRVTNMKYASYPKAEPELNMLDVYIPKKGSNSPIMIWIHGGGWSYGDKENVHEKAEFFTSKGYVFVSINYRLSPKVQHPVHAQDVADAISWIYTNAIHYSADPSKIFLIGHTAGAHLAALVSVNHEYIQNAGASPEIIKGVILLDGAGYDIPALRPQVNGEKIEDWYKQAFGTTKKDWENASPIYYIKPDKTIPPFMIVYVGDREPSQNESLMLAAKLTEAHKFNKVFQYQKKNSLTINKDLGKPDDKLTEDVYRFLQEQNYHAVNPTR
jgi:acetyl esterase/lipase